MIENQVAPRAEARQCLVGSELLARLVYDSGKGNGGGRVSLVRSAPERAWMVAPDASYGEKFVITIMCSA